MLPKPAASRWLAALAIAVVGVSFGEAGESTGGRPSERAENLPAVDDATRSEPLRARLQEAVEHSTVFSSGTTLEPFV